MSPRLSRQEIISRVDLERLGDERLREASALLEADCHAGAVYLGGHAVECFLKAAICHHLKWEALLGVFKTHDLEGLLKYTGLESELQDDSLVYLNFQRIVGLWNDKDGEIAIRYRVPSTIDKGTARGFLGCVLGKPEGLVPWLRKAIS